MKTLLFTTTIKKEKDALNIANLLKNYFGLTYARIDLAEKGNLLKIEGKNILPKKIEQTLLLFGYKCKMLI
jgi:hypothetical protein